MLSYPKTSQKGIAHFIHFLELLLSPKTDKGEVLKIMSRLMSNVSSVYALYILS
jgi:hypothetical protein